MKNRIAESVSGDHLENYIVMIKNNFFNSISLLEVIFKGYILVKNIYIYSTYDVITLFI